MPHNGLPHEGEIDTTLLVANADVDPDSPGAQQLPPAPSATPDPNPALVDIPGTRAFKEHQDALLVQSGFETFKDAVAPTAQAVVRMVEDEGFKGLLGFREEGTAYDKEEAAKRLPPSFNMDQAKAVLLENTLEGHQRAVKRIMDDMERARRLQAQSPGTQLGIMASAFIDMDLPLIAFSGGAIGAAKLTQQMLRTASRMGLTPRIGTRLASGAVGISAGAQAGVVVGVADYAARDVADWTDFAAIMLMSTAAGGILGSTFNLNKALNMKAAEAEFFGRVARDEPSVTEDFDLESMVKEGDSNPTSGATVIGGETPQSLGAAATGTGGRPRRVLEDPAGDIGGAEAGWIDFTDRWRHDGTFIDAKTRHADEWWARVALNDIGGFSTKNFHDLYKGNASVGNWIAGAVFESPSGLGRGRATSSATMEMYHARIQTPIAGKVEPLMHLWAQETGQTWRNSGHFTSNAGRRAWNRELMLEMSDRALGKKSTRSKHLTEAADRYDAAGFEAFAIARGKTGQRALDGFEEASHVKPRSGYNPYRWDGFAINRLLREGVKMKDIERALTEGYRRAGMDIDKDAKAVAKAVLLRARQGDFGMDSSVSTLLSGDGRSFLRENLKLSGMSEVDVENLMRRLEGSSEDAAKEGFAKSRNELDLSVEIKTADGRKLQLVDLLENDMHNTWQRYARQVSGSSALARVGITNRAQRNVVISALQAEQRALGEEVSKSDLIHAMFSHFDAGPVWGFSGGVTQKGIGRVAATAKRLANLGLLEKLGLTQLGETGAMIAQMGVGVYFRRGIAPWLSADLKVADKKLLGDMAYLTGEIGLDHRMYAEWLDLDDVGKAEMATMTEKLQQKLSDYTSNASFIQNYLNVFNQVRTYQHKVAMMGMADKVFRELKFNGGAEGKFLERATRDLGLDLEILQELEALMNDPRMMSWDKDGFVERFHFENWDPDLADTFGSALMRNRNQVVQKSMAGEQDAWMHSGWGSIMTHLMTFPMAAFQKQFLRNAQHMDTQAMVALAMGGLTAMVAVQVRDVIDGRDDDIEGQLVRAFTYNNLTSWIPMIWDPAATVLGQNDARINQYGAFNSLVPPVFTQMDNLRRVPGAAINAVTGDFSYYDRQAAKAAPFAGTFFASRFFDKSQPAAAEPSNNSLSDIFADPGVAAAISEADG